MILERQKKNKAILSPFKSGLNAGVLIPLLGLLLFCLISLFFFPTNIHNKLLFTNLSETNLPPFSPGHLLGTDFLGHDLLTQMLLGGQTSIILALAVASLSVAIGGLWGSISAIAGGKVDMLMMRIVDGLLSVPNVILLLVLQSLAFGFFQNTAQDQSQNIFADMLGVTRYSSGYLPALVFILVLSATCWLEAARVTRAQVLTIRDSEFVHASIALGNNIFGILRKHIIPNILSILMIEAVLLIADAAIIEASLGFLGLGLGPEFFSWGNMLYFMPQNLLAGNWFAAVLPGICVTVLSLTANKVIAN